MREYGRLPEVQCLASELNQVFMNLLVNAAHAIHKPRGTLTVRTGTQGEGDAARVWVEVQDDGCGIAPEALQRIFDPFFTTKPVGQGTGLGLSLSYGIVRKHDGTIDVRSTPGEGSCFRVTLPVRHAGAALPAETVAAAGDTVEAPLCAPCCASTTSRTSSRRCSVCCAARSGACSRPRAAPRRWR